MQGTQGPQASQGTQGLQGPLAPVGVALKGLVPGELGDAIGDAVKGAGKAGAGFFKSVGHKAGEKVKGFFDALEESRKP